MTAVSAMSWWQVVDLAVLQGLTEFLPVSSSGHLAIASRLFFNDDAGASFTAVSQLGTEAAVLVYFARRYRTYPPSLVQRAGRQVTTKRRLSARLVRHCREASRSACWVCYSRMKSDRVFAICG